MRTHKEYLNNCFVTHATRDDSKYVVGGVLLAGAVTALTSNVVLGGAIALLGYGLAFKQIWSDGKRIRLMGETGAVAPFLKGEDYQRYIDTFGTEEADKQAVCVLRLGSQPYGDAMDGLTERHPGIEDHLDTLPILKPGAIYFDPAPVQPINASLDGSKLAIGALMAASDVSTSRVLEVVDVAEIMGRSLKPTIISAMPRSGKGVLIANAWRAAKRHHPDLKVYVIDPKAHPDESGYWAGCDRVYSKRFDQILVNDEQTISEIEAFIDQWRNDSAPKKLLIFDEQVLAESKLPKWYREYVPAFAKAEGSAGETYHRYLWLVMQSPLIGDIGLSGGSRSIYVSCAIATNRQTDGMNSQAWMNSAKASKFIPSIPTEQQFAASPRGTLCYSSLMGGWVALPIYPVPAPLPLVQAAIAKNPLQSLQSPALSPTPHQPIQPSQVIETPQAKKPTQNPLQDQYERVRVAVSNFPKLAQQLKRYKPLFQTLMNEQRRDLVTIALFSMEHGAIKAKDVYNRAPNRRKLFHPIKIEGIRQLFEELESRGMGEVIGDDPDAFYTAFLGDERTLSTHLKSDETALPFHR